MTENNEMNFDKEIEELKIQKLKLKDAIIKLGGSNGKED